MIAGFTGLTNLCTFVLTFPENLYIYKGGYDYYQSNSSGKIQSPNFPGGYPSDYSAEFVLQNIDTSGFVQLIFTDFQLSLWSYVEVSGKPLLRRHRSTGTFTRQKSNYAYLKTKKCFLCTIIIGS